MRFGIGIAAAAAALIFSAPAEAAVYVGTADAGEWVNIPVQTYTRGSVEVKLFVERELTSDSPPLFEFWEWHQWMPVPSGYDIMEVLKEFEFGPYDSSDGSYSGIFFVSSPKPATFREGIFVEDPRIRVVNRTGSALKYRAVISGTALVPEPATWATMILGFGLVGATTRRRLRSALL